MIIPVKKKSGNRKVTHNLMSLIRETVEDEETITKLTKYLRKYKDIKDTNIRLIKYGSYYKLKLGLDVNNKMNLRRISDLENKIRHRSLKIKYVSIYVTNKLENRQRNLSVFYFQESHNMIIYKYKNKKIGSVITWT